MSNKQLQSMISVIIPTCDRPDLLIQAINSVVLQTYGLVEIIICDNGIVPVDQKLLDPYNVIYHYLSPRVGASKARNHGVKLSNGKFLAFLDDDDTWDKEFLDLTLKRLRADKLDCVYGAKYIKKSGIISKYKVIQKKDLTLEVLLSSNPGVGGINLLVRKDVFLLIGGFDTLLPRGNDRAFAIDLILNNAIIGVEPRAIAIMLHHDGVRLRDSHIEMLLWVNKYKSHMSTYSFFAAVIRILLASINGKFRKFFL